MSRQRKTTKDNERRGWVILHLPLREDMVSRIDRKAKAETTLQPISRTVMARVLIERGLEKDKATA